jgi:hypothetical protein
MSLDYTANHLTAAFRSLATSEDPLAERLQTVWDEQVQMVWMKPCLTRELLGEATDMAVASARATGDRVMLGHRAREPGSLRVRMSACCI